MRLAKPNNISDRNTHGERNHGLFCVTGQDSGFIDIEDLY